jgi:hypothetical protein
MKKQPYEKWPHPCDRPEVRSFVLSLAALEKLRRDTKLRTSVYLVWRREFAVGLGAALRASLDDFFREPPVKKQLRGRRRTKHGKRVG